MSNSKEHGIEAVNQEFKRYEQVEKDQTYNLAEKQEEDQFDDEYVIETCDISEFMHGDEASKATFAQKLGKNCLSASRCAFLRRCRSRLLPCPTTIQECLEKRPWCFCRC